MLIFKITNSMRQGYGYFQYPESGQVECPDWKPSTECGNGLHGWAKGEGSYRHGFNTGVFLVIDVKDQDVVSLGDKVKFPRGNVLYSGTREGAVAYLIDAGVLTKESDPAWACLTPKQLVTCAMRSADRAIRKHAPKGLRAQGRTADAEKLEALPQIETREQAITAKTMAREIYYAAASNAAANAANAAATAAYAAAANAYYAAADAAYDAANAAAAAYYAAANAAYYANARKEENEAARLDKLEMLGLVGSVRS